MSVTIELPENIEKKLAEAWGGDLTRAAMEALVADACRANLLSIGQTAKLLGLSIDGANGFLKARGIIPSFSPADLDAEVESLKTALDRQEARR